MSLLPGGALKTLRALQMESGIRREISWPGCNHEFSTHRPRLPGSINFVHVFQNLSTALISPRTSQNVPVDSLLF